MSTRIECFVISPTEEYEVFLRRYSTSPYVPPCLTGLGTYHDVSASIGRSHSKDVLSYDSIIGAPLVGDFYPHDSPGWPTACKCGFKFESFDSWLYQPRQVYKRVDTGETGILESFPSGALWRNTWLEKSPYYTGTDGQSWSVRTPAGPWMIDSRASNCNLPDNSAHNCWCRHGVAPNFTVDKVGNTCKAGAGSIAMPGYHGFLRSGFLEQC